MAVEDVDHFPRHELSVFSIDGWPEVDSRIERGARKGTGQLHESSRRFLGGEPISEPGLTREHTHTIHPVIITTDPALTGPFVARYLDRKLERRLLRSKGKHVAIAPLQLATFPDIERLLPYTTGVSVTGILEAANKSAFPSGNLLQRARAAIAGIKPSRDLLEQEWDAFSSDVLNFLPPS
jgi:hypothetical protein